MSTQTIQPIQKIHGTLTVPGDKSISHRALILGGLCEGEITIRGLLDSEDVGRTATIMQALGVELQYAGELLSLRGCGLHGLSEPRQRLDCGNSGTTLRLMSGLLAGQSFKSELIGDASLDRRPMDRIILPLAEMGAKIREVMEEGRRVIQIEGRALKGIEFQSPIASAQVKSALLLAGLYAEQPLKLREPIPSRDHTERMMKYLGATIDWGPGRAELEPTAPFQARNIRVPADFSSAAFFLVAALIYPQSSVRLNGVLMNPTRTGLLQVLEQMGAKIRVENQRDDCGEPIADLIAESSSLRGVECPAHRIPSLIDEIPILAIAACAAEGPTRISGAEELRVKETDRIQALSSELQCLGVSIEEKPNGLVIHGPAQIQGGSVSSHGDHRMAMALTVAGGGAQGPVTIEDYECVAVSYPGFLQDWERLTAS